MKLISTCSFRKVMAVALLISLTNLAFGNNNSSKGLFKVFWNKFEVVSNKDNATVELSWNVTEYNNKSFVVQHSSNGTDWVNVAVVQSQHSAESMTDYSYIHVNKQPGKHFYRIKDIDVDIQSGGTSPVKTLVLEKARLTVSIWPNPASNHISIVNDDDNTYSKARIIDLTGKVMIENKLDAHTSEIGIQDLPAGTYIVKLENKKGESYSQKIVKQ